MITKDINYYELRVKLLRARDPIANVNIIKKLERKIRSLSK